MKNLGLKPTTYEIVIITICLTLRIQIHNVYLNDYVIRQPNVSGCANKIAGYGKL